MMLLFQVFLSVVIIFEFRMMRWEIFTKFSHIQNKILKIEKSTSPKSESATTSVFSLLAFSFFEVFGLGFGFSSSSLSENVLYLILLLFSCLRLEFEVFVLNILIQLANSMAHITPAWPILGVLRWIALKVPTPTPTHLYTVQWADRGIRNVVTDSFNVHSQILFWFTL